MYDTRFTKTEKKNKVETNGCLESQEAREEGTEESEKARS
jgi:hypothetical protein